MSAVHHTWATSIHHWSRSRSHPSAAAHHPTCVHAVHRSHTTHLSKHARVQRSQRLRIKRCIAGHALHVGHGCILVEIRVVEAPATACSAASALELITLRARLSELDINLMNAAGEKIKRDFTGW
jgi:hypothetical protein